MQLAGKVRICFVDGSIEEIEEVHTFELDKNNSVYNIHVNGYVIFVNASQVRYLGRAFDLDNEKEYPKQKQSIFPYFGITQLDL